MNYYQNYGFNNPYMNTQGVNPNMQIPMNQPIQPINRMDSTYQSNFNSQPQFQSSKQLPTLQGKSVEGIDVVKAMDIPLDGSISYFPIADGSAIVTKQLQMDGTSKTIVYKPIDLDEPIKDIKFVTQDELDETLKNFDTSNLKDEIKNIKKQLRDLNKTFKSKDIEEEED